jgi:hypothetical protein
MKAWHSLRRLHGSTRTHEDYYHHDHYPRLRTTTWLKHIVTSASLSVSLLYTELYPNRSLYTDMTKPFDSGCSGASPRSERKTSRTRSCVAASSTRTCTPVGGTTSLSRRRHLPCENAECLRAFIVYPCYSHIVLVELTRLLRSFVDGRAP